MAASEPYLVPATLAHLRELMGWFHDQASTTIWAGPRFRFPFTEASFVEDAKFSGTNSLVLQDCNGRLLGFGQYYNRLQRCHLARLAIAPGARGRGLGAIMIPALCRLAYDELGFAQSSLFVYPHNEPALRLYRRLGFAAQTYPEPLPEMAGCQYLVGTTADIMDFA